MAANDPGAVKRGSPMRYIIAYDIGDDRRRLRVAKFLEGWGRRVQKSVFECKLSPDELDKIHTRLKQILILDEDRCHLYRLCGECVPKRIVIGTELELDLEGTRVV
jgi:CRISPR-associated protein Cas2